MLQVVVKAEMLSNDRKRIVRSVKRRKGRSEMLQQPVVFIEERIRRNIFGFRKDQLFLSRFHATHSLSGCR